MININKSLIIFSHQRSGGTWFQSALPHFNAHELFNLNLDWTSVTERPQFHNSIGRYYTPNHPKPDRYAEIDLENELKIRYNIYNELENKHTPLSVKINLSYINDNLIKFLSTKDVDYVVMERKDKIASFWSYIVAWTTNQFHFFEPKTQEIVVTKEVFNSVSGRLLDFVSTVSALKKIFPMKHMYYEDILNLEVSDWWVRPNNRIKIQNAVKITTITNRDEVMSWIEEIDLFNRI